MEEPPQEEGEEKVGNQNRDGGINHRLGRRVADPFGAVPTRHAFVASDNGDDATEGERFDLADGEIGNRGVAQHVVPRVGRVNTEQVYADDVAACDADRNGFPGENRHHQNCREQSWYDEVIDRMRGQGPERINLFGDPHSADFCGDCGADPAGNHQAGQDRSQFAAHGNSNQRERGGVHLDLMELIVSLRSEHHSGEGAGDEYHGLRFNADEIDLIDEIAPRDFESEKGDKRFLDQQAKTSQAA